MFVVWSSLITLLQRETYTAVRSHASRATHRHFQASGGGGGGGGGGGKQMLRIAFSWTSSDFGSQEVINDQLSPSSNRTGKKLAGSVESGSSQSSELAGEN